MIICHIVNTVWQINLWEHFYTVLLELCVCINISAQGKYHCKYIRWTAYSILVNDIVVSTDNIFDYLPYTLAVIIPFSIITAGLLTTTILAIRHYIRVRRIKHSRHEA